MTTIEEYVKIKSSTKGAITKAVNAVKKLQEARQELMNEYFQKKTALAEEYSAVLEEISELTQTQLQFLMPNSSVSQAVPDETTLVSTPVMDEPKVKTVTISDVATHLDLSVSTIRSYWTWGTNAPVSEVNEKLTEMGYPMM